MQMPWVLSLALLVACVGVAWGEEKPTPEETVRSYLASLKDAKPEVTFDLVSKAMRQNKSREEWVKEQRAFMAFADVKIFDYDVQPAKIEGETAKVPNVLESQDRFVNQIGLTEYELYTLVKEEGRWKIDSQIIVEPPDMPKWFPKMEKGKQAAKPGDKPAEKPAEKPPAH